MFFFGGGKSFTPEKDIPDLSGKVILVTGGNTGLGLETVTQLAKHNPSCIYLAARNPTKASQAISEVLKTSPNANIKHIQLDLSSFTSIASAVDAFLSSCSRLDILINNAGIMGTPYAKTGEGYELQFGTNHMGPALLTKLLLPTLLKTAAQPTADVRVVWLGSEAHRAAPGCGIQFDQDALERELSFRRYGQSKLATTLHAKQLAARHPSITSVSVHPGVILTDLWGPLGAQNLLMKPIVAVMGLLGPLLFSTVRTGARNELWAAAAQKGVGGVVSGAYYLPVGAPCLGSAWARNEGLAERLWDWTEGEFERCGF
ncbi:NAD(P)-binding protein [Saccharata proteae CBS 121410]|uniref:NAD(P)-binding protein n=1 Tax=Saccharata proteae CBS 121410 TaxID=1314787 RepID=A0A9P4LW27_9PEZI|nr:NAD(P)-binding protein [Saccharata proteae CBS 121410]